MWGGTGVASKVKQRCGTILAMKLGHAAPETDNSGAKISLFMVFADKFLHFGNPSLENEIAIVGLAFGDVSGDGS